MWHFGRRCSFTLAQFIVANPESPIINLLPNAPGCAGRRVAAGVSAGRRCKLPALSHTSSFEWPGAALRTAWTGCVRRFLGGDKVDKSSVQTRALASNLGFLVGVIDTRAATTNHNDRKSGAAPRRLQTASCRISASRSAAFAPSPDITTAPRSST